MIRGKKVQNEKAVNDVNLTLNAAIHNRFDIEVIDAETGNVKQKAQALNTICNKLWDTLFENSKGYFNYIQFGSGSGTPSSADSSLFGFLGSKLVENLKLGISTKDGVMTSKGSIQLKASEYIGETISEVGISVERGSSGYLCTHAMLKDMNGNQISFEKTDKDVININATIYVHFEKFGYDNGSVFVCKEKRLGYICYGNKGGWSYYESDKSSTQKTIERYFGLIPAILGSQKFAMYNAFVFGSQCHNDGLFQTYQHANLSFDKSNKSIILKADRIENDKGNERNGYAKSGITHIMLNEGTEYYKESGEEVNTSRLGKCFPLLIKPGGIWFQHSKITGEPVGTGDGTTKDFSLNFSWPKNAKIYVDGIEQSNVTVDYTYKPEYSDTDYLNVLPTYYFIDEGSTDENHIEVFYNKGETVILYNKQYALGKLSVIILSGPNNPGTIYASNDLITWCEIAGEEIVENKTVSVEIPVEYRRYKYFKYKNMFAYSTNMLSASDMYVENNVHFSEPPAAGAVITADYEADCIAKDADHVFDFSLTIQLGEHTEAQ